MYTTGSIVILNGDKTYGEAGDEVTLRSGTCGMINRAASIVDDERHYVVDFGAYGSWYCRESELNGDNVLEEETESIETDTPLSALVESESSEPPMESEQKKDEAIVDVERDIQRMMEKMEKEIT